MIGLLVLLLFPCHLQVQYEVPRYYHANFQAKGKQKAIGKTRKNQEKQQLYIHEYKYIITHISMCTHIGDMSDVKVVAELLFLLSWLLFASIS